MIVRGWGLVLGFLLLFALPRASVAATLTIMAEDSSEPFSRADGTGYANDIVRAAFQAEGVAVTLDPVPYARCKRDVESGKIPACLAMSWQKAFEGIIAFSDLPIFSVYADVFRRNGAAAKILRAEDLGPGAVVGIVNEYEYPASLSCLQSNGVVLERGINEAAILRMLARGRLDAAVVMTSDFERPSQRAIDAGVADAVSFAFRSGTMQSYLGFSLSNPQGMWARLKFNAGYKQIIENGTRDSIRARWMKETRP